MTRPTSSETLSTPIDFMRQRDALHLQFLRQRELSFVGVGAGGSWAALAVCKMVAEGARHGVTQVYLVDGDTCAAHNVPNQVIGPVDVAQGLSKVDALAAHIEALCGFRPRRVCQFLDHENAALAGQLRDIIVVCTDTMSSRSAVFSLAAANPLTTWLVDTRMGGGSLTLLCCRLHSRDEDAYRQALYDDSDAVELPCTARALAPWSAMAGAWTSRAIYRILAGLPVERRIDFDTQTLALIVDPGETPQ